MNHELPKKSPGHIAFFRTTLSGSLQELYIAERGHLVRADVDSVMDTQTGYRFGRWEAPPHIASARALQLLGPSFVRDDAAGLEPITSARQWVNTYLASQGIDPEDVYLGDSRRLGKLEEQKGTPCQPS